MDSGDHRTTDSPRCQSLYGWYLALLTNGLADHWAKPGPVKRMTGGGKGRWRGGWVGRGKVSVTHIGAPAGARARAPPRAGQRSPGPGNGRRALGQGACGGGERGGGGEGGEGGGGCRRSLCAPSPGGWCPPGFIIQSHSLRAPYHLLLQEE